MPRLALFGSAGMFGRDAAPLFREAGWTVAEGDLPLVDIADPASVEQFFQANPSEVVVNAAAYTNVDGAESEPEAAHRANAVGPSVLAEACARRKMVLVHISTDYVFPGTRLEGYLPEEPPGPAASVYGRTKLEGEEAIRAILPEEHYLICRTQWLYGTTGKNFPDTILRLAATRPGLRVVDDQWGVPTWTRELARQIVQLLARGARGTHHTVNGGGPITWFTFASAIVHEAGLTCAVVPCATEEFPRPAARPRFGWLKDPEISTPHPWEEGLREYLASRKC